MRRLLLPLLVLSLMPVVPASAGCDPEGECHPSDCMVWEPRLPRHEDVAYALSSGDPSYALRPLLPPPCP
jgi:hypothetical protein